MVGTLCVDSTDLFANYLCNDPFANYLNSSAKSFAQQTDLSNWSRELVKGTGHNLKFSEETRHTLLEVENRYLKP